VTHRPGVLQNRVELRDRRLLLADADQPYVVVIVPTYITYHLGKERNQETMAPAGASERKDSTITGVEEPGLRPNAAAADALDPGMRTRAVWSRWCATPRIAIAACRHLHRAGIERGASPGAVTGDGSR